MLAALAGRCRYVNNDNCTDDVDSDGDVEMWEKAHLDFALLSQSSLILRPGFSSLSGWFSIGSWPHLFLTSTTRWTTNCWGFFHHIIMIFLKTLLQVWALQEQHFSGARSSEVAGVQWWCFFSRWGSDDDDEYCSVCACQDVRMMVLDIITMSNPPQPIPTHHNMIENIRFWLWPCPPPPLPLRAPCPLQA